MRCAFKATEETHASGRQLLRCVRSGCKSKGLMPPSGNVAHLIAICAGRPLANELHHWIALFAEASGVNDVIAKANFLAWRARGSKLEELPASIPKPELPPLGFGPGTELEKILASVGAKGDCGGLCQEWRDKMNWWGVDGCKAHRAEIVERLQNAAYKSWVTEQVKIGWALMKQPWFNPRDPFGSIVDEAIRRAVSSAQPDS